MSKVKVITRVADHGEVTLISRGEEALAILPEGDPLRYLLQLPVDRLRSMKQELAPVLRRRPEVARVLDAIIEYQAERAEDSGAGGLRSATVAGSEEWFPRINAVRRCGHEVRDH